VAERREEVIFFEFCDKLWLLVSFCRELVFLVVVPRGGWLALVLVPDNVDWEEPGITWAILFRREIFPIDLTLLDLTLASVGARDFGFFTKFPPPRPYVP
jgi:hypothetical protein